MTRLDHNRAMGQVAARADAPVASVTNVSIWGNHSATQYPDIFHAKVGARPALEAVGGLDWVEKEFIPTVQQRGAADHRGPRSLERRLCRHRSHRLRARLGARHQGGGLDVDGGLLGRSLRDARRASTAVSRSLRPVGTTRSYRVSTSTSFLATDRPEHGGAGRGT